jgi:molybdopterin-guanine dinucleotide biosynthesis protein A
MIQAGWVLTGGKSTRMGRNKALLPYRGRTLVEHVAGLVEIAAGSVSLVGEPEIYGHLGRPVFADVIPGRGPLSGIHAVLCHTEADWNLVVACDMPELSTGFLVSLLYKAEHGGADCLIPAGPSGMPEPLCAAYHRRCLEAVTRALARNVHKVTEGLSALDTEIWNVTESAMFQNLNTPQEWTGYSNG